jgi:hypothetical protein
MIDYSDPYTYSGKPDLMRTDKPCHCGANCVTSLGLCTKCGTLRRNVLHTATEDEILQVKTDSIIVGECPCNGNIIKYLPNKDNIATCEKCFKRYKIILREIEER